MFCSWKGSRPRCLPARCLRTASGSAPYLPERFREKYLKKPGPACPLVLWITEGRKHQVKLMIKAVGGHVFYQSALPSAPSGWTSAPPGRIPPVDVARVYTSDQRQRYC